MTRPNMNEAVDALLGVWDDYTVADLGPHLTCNESDALAAFLCAAGRPHMAEALIEGHAEADDDPDDLHYQGDEPRPAGFEDCGCDPSGHTSPCLKAVTE